MSVGDRIKKKLGINKPHPLPTPAPPPLKLPPNMKSRLPDGAKFEAAWNGKIWTGTLRVPGGSFEAEHTSLTKLCYRLDDKYREWLVIEFLKTPEIPGAKVSDYMQRMIDRAEKQCTCGADRAGPSAEAHDPDCPAKFIDVGGSPS